MTHSAEIAVAPPSETGTHAIYRETRMFSCLDGLRALAILAVIWHHVGINLENVLLTQSGYLGVDLFFALSGFLITTLLLRERDRYGRISLKAFYIRRSLRIFPLYYAVILLYVMVVWLVEPDAGMQRQFFGNLVYFLSYTSNWFVELDGRVIFYFAWSLATEEQFYLLWPSVERFLTGWRVVAVITLVLLLRFLVQIAVESGDLSNSMLVVRIVLSIHPAILGGALLAHVLHDERGFDWVRPWLGGRWAALLVLVSLIGTIASGMSMWLVWFLMVMLVGSVAIRETNILGPFLRWRPMAHIGLVSYGMYLMHMLCLNAVNRALPYLGIEARWVTFVATVALTTLVASLSYRYFESWFLRIKDRYARIPSRQAAAA